jgi:cytochrome c oxidase cbb3-type subunit 1
VQDALTQWWYGHNAVGFFLTAGFLGMMYYFIPKQAERPVYSYRLSIIHFWALIFLYIWAGPHHLHYTALPDWAQTLGMVFSIMLWMPSWGGMINGLMTLSGAWDKLRTDPVIRDDGDLGGLLRHVDLRRSDDVDQGGQLAQPLHRLDHRPRALRCAGLGRHDLVRRDLLPGAEAVEPRTAVLAALVNWHFWLATIGIVLYAAVLWVAGIMQGLMWREYDDQGFLVNSFAETVAPCIPIYVMRAIGGGCT